MQFCPKCGGRSFASQPGSSASPTQTVPGHNSYGAQTFNPNAQWQQSSGQSSSYGKAMSFPAAIGSCLRNYFTIRGRAPRSEYWWFQLAYTIAFCTSLFLVAVSDIYWILYISVVIGGIIPQFTVSVRRLHDIDRSGWWLLLFLVPLIGAILWLVWYLERGTQGFNRFGPDPLTQDPNGVVNAQII